MGIVASIYTQADDKLVVVPVGWLFCMDQVLLSLKEVTARNFYNDKQAERDKISEEYDTMMKAIWPDYVTEINKTTGEGIQTAG